MTKSPTLKPLSILLALLVFLYTACDQQEDRLEVELMNCVYSSYPDGGIQLKKTITNFEEVLVKDGILKDNSGKSYRDIFKKIANHENISYQPSQSFLKEWQKVGPPDTDKVKRCQLKLLLRLQTTKEEKLDVIMDSLLQHQNVSAANVANLYLSVLDNKDFELDYYKFRFLSTFSMLDTNNGILRSLPIAEEKEEEKEYDLKGALEIYLNENSEILVNQQLVSLSELKERVREFESKNRSASVIKFSTSNEARYAAYMQIQTAVSDEINKLRDELSRQQYGLDFQELNAEQAEEIQNTYPIRLVEQ